MFHDPDNGNARTDRRRAATATTSPSTRRMELDEERGEDLRLLYVALTRAQHQAVLWWVGARTASTRPWPGCCSTATRRAWCARYGSAVATPTTTSRRRSPALGPGWRSSASPIPPDVRWHRGRGCASDARSGRLRSSARPRMAPRVVLGHHARRSTTSRRSGANPSEQLTSDEELRRGHRSARPLGSPRRTSACGRCRSAWPPCPAARSSEHVVHSVLERTDFDAPDLAAEVGAALEREVAWRNVDLGSRDAVVAGSVRRHRVPLGPLVGDVRLRDIAAPRPA